MLFVFEAVCIRRNGMQLANLCFFHGQARFEQRKAQAKSRSAA